MEGSSQKNTQKSYKTIADTYFGNSQELGRIVLKRRETSNLQLLDAAFQNAVIIKHVLISTQADMVANKVKDDPTPLDAIGSRIPCHEGLSDPQPTQPFPDNEFTFGGHATLLLMICIVYLWSISN